MTGPDLERLRTRFGLSRKALAQMVLHRPDQMMIYHWEKGYWRIPRTHQLTLGRIFATLAAGAPPTERCPLCDGSGLISQGEEKTSAKG